MFPYVFALAQDTTAVAVVRDELSTVLAWTQVGAALAFAALLVVLALILVELRHLSRAWSGFLEDTSQRSQSIIEHARGAARNAEHITKVVRAEVDRLDGALTGLSTGIGEVSDQVRTRLTDLAALADVVQSEAEDAVLDGAAKVRMLRSGAGLLNLVRGGAAASEKTADAPDPEVDGDAPDEPAARAEQN